MESNVYKTLEMYAAKWSEGESEINNICIIETYYLYLPMTEQTFPVTR